MEMQFSVYVSLFYYTVVLYFSEYFFLTLKRNYLYVEQNSVQIYRIQRLFNKFRSRCMHVKVITFRSFTVLNRIRQLVFYIPEHRVRTLIDSDSIKVDLHPFLNKSQRYFTIPKNRHWPIISAYEAELIPQVWNEDFQCGLTYSVPFTSRKSA